MRVLHCIWSMGGGGAERQLAYLAGGLRQLGVEVHVALLRAGPNMERLEKSGAQVHHLRVRGKYDPTLLLRFSRLVWRVKPDLIHTWLAQMDIVGGIAAQLSGTPWVLSERSSAMNYGPSWLYRVRNAIAKRMPPAAIVSNSRGGDDYWNALAPSRIVRRIIPNCVPASEIESAPKTDVAGDKPLVLFVGRFSPEKNLPTLIAALAVILPKFNAVAALCGDGPMASEVRETVAAAGLADRVLMPGYVDDVWGWMRRASVCVSVGFYEGDPNAVKEAIAARCPLVLSDMPGHRQLAGDGAAIFVDPHGAESIAAGLESALSDSAASARRAEVAYARIADCSPARIASAYRDFYNELLGSKLVERGAR